MTLGTILIIILILITVALIDRFSGRIRQYFIR